MRHVAVQEPGLAQIRTTQVRIQQCGPLQVRAEQDAALQVG